jgi:hypothetical protein
VLRFDGNNNWNIIQHLASAVPWPYPEDGATTFITRELERVAAGEEIYNWMLVLRGGGVALPEVRLFVERLAADYRAACGEQLVVTSLAEMVARSLTLCWRFLSAVLSNACPIRWVTSATSPAIRLACAVS